MEPLDNIDLAEDSLPEDTVKLHRKCVFCKKEFTITLNANKWRRWHLEKEHTQSVWPYFDGGQRELIISGSHEACWDLAFAGMDQ